MQSKPRYGLADYFAEIKDPRMERRKRHKLIDFLVHSQATLWNRELPCNGVECIRIIAVAICGVVCGAETWVDIENFRQNKSKKIGIRAKQFVASMDETYLDEVLAAIF
jgi:hypothetical protein